MGSGTALDIEGKLESKTNKQKQNAPCPHGAHSPVEETDVNHPVTGNTVTVKERHC